MGTPSSVSGVYLRLINYYNTCLQPFVRENRQTAPFLASPGRRPSLFSVPIRSWPLPLRPRLSSASMFVLVAYSKPDCGYISVRKRFQLRVPTAVLCGPPCWVSTSHIPPRWLCLLRPGCHGQGAVHLHRKSCGWEPTQPR